MKIPFSISAVILFGLLSGPIFCKAAGGGTGEDSDIAKMCHDFITARFSDPITLNKVCVSPDRSFSRVSVCTRLKSAITDDNSFLSCLKSESVDDAVAECAKVTQLPSSYQECVKHKHTKEIVKYCGIEGGSYPANFVKCISKTDAQIQQYQKSKADVENLFK